MEVIGDIIQITDKDHDWFPVLLIVTEPKSWGVQACVLIPIRNFDKNSCLEVSMRIESRKYKVVGKAEHSPG